MVTASVSVSFEAASADEARAKIAEWNLQEGCNVAINITESMTFGTISSSGALVVATPEVPDEPAS